MNQSWWLDPCKAIDGQARDAAFERQQQLTKPTGSLGLLEQVAVQLAGLQGRLKPRVDHLWIAIFAGDHGVVAEGVSAYPQPTRRKSPGRCWPILLPAVRRSACWRGSWGRSWM